MCCNYNKNTSENKNQIRVYFYSGQEVLTTCLYFLLLPAQSRKHDGAHKDEYSGSVCIVSYNSTANVTRYYRRGNVGLR